MKNMNKKILVILFILSVFTPAQSAASEKTMRLICTYSHTIDQNSESRATSGDSLFTIKYTNKGSATIKKQDLGAIFYGAVTEEEINGETQFKIQDNLIVQTLNINRFTGSFSLSYGTKEGGIVHLGTCKPANEKLF
jgi:hypothetical protein